MITISLGSLLSEQKAKKVQEVLQGATYYDFNVTYGRCAGNYPTQVSTKYQGAKEEEVIDMIMHVLARSL